MLLGSVYTKCIVGVIDTGEQLIAGVNDKTATKQSFKYLHEFFVKGILRDHRETDT